MRWGRWSRAGPGTPRPGFHASSAITLPGLCPIPPWEGEAPPWGRPLCELAVRPWRSHRTSLSCSFRPYKMGTITLPKPILQTSCQNQMSHEFQRVLQALQFMRREGYFQRCLKSRSGLQSSKLCQLFPDKSGPPFPTSFPSPQAEVQRELDLQWERLTAKP